MSRAEELIAAFDEFTGRYKREEMEEAITLQEEITPLLLNILEEVIADPQGYADELHHAETYAVALLAHFREEKAHLPIIRAFSIPDEPRDYIWGDMLTETFPAVLCRTSGGDYTHVMALIRNRNAYEFTRASAMEAIKLGMLCGHLTRKECLALYESLFEERLAEPGDFFWGSLVCDLLDLHAVELREKIDALFDKGFIYEGEVSLEDVEQSFSVGYEEAMRRLDDKREWRLPEDLHDYVSWFACFSEKPSTGLLQAPSPLKAQKKQKEKDRNKRKQAKQSKRKNRR